MPRRPQLFLTGKGSTVSAKDWKAELRRHYPRTPEEVAANKVVDTRPVRA